MAKKITYRCVFKLDGERMEVVGELPFEFLKDIMDDDHVRFKE